MSILRSLIKDVAYVCWSDTIHHVFSLARQVNLDIPVRYLYNYKSDTCHLLWEALSDVRSLCNVVFFMDTHVWGDYGSLLGDMWGTE